MPAFEAFTKEQRVKLLLIGDSGSGKTGLLSTLANQGYNLRILDLEGNLNVMNSYLTPEGRKRVHYFPLDPSNEKTLQAFNALIRRWRVNSDEDLGDVKTWGNDDVLVVDSATKFGEACLAGTKAPNNHLPSHYMVAGEELKDSMHWLLGPGNLKCNVVVIAHIRYIDIPHPTIQDKTIIKAYPTCLGKTLPQSFSQDFTDVFSIKVSPVGQTIKRVIRTDADGMLGMKSSNPSVLKTEEEFNLGVIFDKLLGKERKVLKND